ncbi:PrsW family glutamic-type intramembrane protease [Actinomycetospora chibensis]|uniref:PrsW family glutamic-type intramembrane protease n=1 Tax=Actinomycetospora chibensis TaxID=663606 RepID=A0ABV9RIX8_9PSEU|nr:PrsW family glutamic-type intramembrane protease [Actinomycetospora chibensis]MDD7927219.1 PrsW family glutamic-type intramembrane protease [Actinomycetospora chibensis]
MTPPGSRLPDLSVLFPFRAWLRHPALRAWTTWLFVALVATPPAALALFRDASGVGGEATTFAAYFAAAWFLVLWVVVRPQAIKGSLLLGVVVLALVLEAPLALAMEEFVDGDMDNLAGSIFGAGLPEELAKMLPVVLVVLAQRRLGLVPRDTLFLGAVSGLVFGAVEAVYYATGSSGGGTYSALILVWRFVTDPIAHALWSGVAGYFVGLAAHYRAPGPFFALIGIGIGVPALLHGLNNWVPVNTSILWVVVTVVSALLFLAYARVGLVPTRPVAPIAPPLAPPGRAGRPAVVDPPTAPIAMPQHSSGRHALV